MSNEEQAVNTVEEQTSQETVEETTQTNDTEETVSVEEFKKLQEQNKQLYARLKKQETTQTETHSQSVDIEQVQFFAQGGTQEEYQEIQAIMKGKGVSFAEAKDDPLIKAYGDKIRAEKRAEQAQVGASRGTGAPQKGIEIKQGMSRDEHREAWLKSRST